MSRSFRKSFSDAKSNKTFKQECKARRKLREKRRITNETPVDNDHKRQ